jgi:hypothetical protein
MAWAKLETDGDPDYHGWMEFHPKPEAIVDSLDNAIKLGLEDCASKNLRMESKINFI